MLAFFFASFIVVLAAPESVLLLMAKSTYLPIHTFLEFLGIFASLGIFLIGWTTYKNVGSHKILYLSISSLAVAFFDFGHTLSFVGMPKFVTDSEPNKAIYFWLAGRLTDSFAFLLVALELQKMDFRKWRWPGLILSLIWVGGVYYLVLLRPEALPLMFIKGEGLTPLKIAIELIGIAMSLVAGFLFFRRWQSPQNKITVDLSNKLMTCGCVLFALAGFLFCLYREVDDLYNLIGHIYKALAFIYIFSAVFLVCVKQPYQEMKRLGIEAQTANDSKSRFLANVSHEFRTPLGVISGFGELLQGKQLDEESSKWVHTIYRNSEQLRVLIDDLLDLTKAESGKLSLSSSVFDVRNLISEVVQGVEILAAQKNVRLILNIDPEVPKLIQMDSVRLRQILLNILGNAVKFTLKGFIEVRVTSPEQYKLQFSIEDSGVGISPESAGFLFRPFSQVDDSFTRRFGGTGLGLALSRKLAQLLDGDLWLEKSELGVGSVFAFTVTYAAATVVSADSKEQKSTLPSLQGLRILVTEDSQDIRLLLKHYLKDTQAPIAMVENGAQAVEKLKTEDADVVLMDIQMPEMDGISATKIIRSLGWEGAIIAMTAHAHESEKNYALNNGFNEYLVKPFKKSELIHLLAKFHKK